MDKKQLKKVTTKVYEEYGFLKNGKYYYLDLDDVLICSGFFTIYGVTFLAYNFCVKNIHSEDERKLNNMFDGYDSGENDIHFNKNAKGICKSEIRYEEWTEEYYADKLKELLHYYFDPFKKDAFSHIKKACKKIGYIHKNDIMIVSAKAREYIGIQ